MHLLWFYRQSDHNIILSCVETPDRLKIKNLYKAIRYNFMKYINTDPNTDPNRFVVQPEFTVTEI